MKPQAMTSEELVAEVKEKAKDVLGKDPVAARQDAVRLARLSNETADRFKTLLDRKES